MGDMFMLSEEGLARIEPFFPLPRGVGQPMPTHIKRANSARSKVRAPVEHPFADQKHRMGLRIRIIGLARATIKIGIANMACNMRRLTYHETQRVKCA